MTESNDQFWETFSAFLQQGSLNSKGKKEIMSVTAQFAMRLVIESEI